MAEVEDKEPGEIPVDYVAKEGADVKKRNLSVLAARAKQAAESAPAQQINDEEFLFTRLDYKIFRDREYGSGEFSKYFKAKGPNNTNIGVKILPLTSPSKPYRDYMKTNAVKVMRLLSTIQHENVITFYDIFLTSSKMYFFCELVEGFSLESLCKANAFKEPEIKSWIKSMIEGLTFLYESAIGHRNLSAANVLVTNDRKTIKISGFGRSMITYNHITNEEILSPVLETYAHHYAPETQTGPFDAHAADMWSLGVIIVNLLTSKHPFNKKTKDYLKDVKLHFRRYLVDITSNLDDLLMRMFDEPATRISVYNAIVHWWIIS